MGKQYGIAATLEIDGDSAPITDFDLSVPTGALGSGLSCSLADFEASVSDTDPIDFDITITKGGDSETVRLLESGRMLSSSASIQLDGDTLKVDAVNPLADRWQIAPRSPLVLYDPSVIDIVTASEATRDDILDADSNPIEAEFRAVDGFDLAQLLNFVYVEQLGFTRVITNIESYPLQRADFSLRASWHSVAASELAIFQPVYGADDADTLFILDPQGTIPPSMPIRNLPLSKYVQVIRQTQTSALINAVIFTYRDNTFVDAFSGAVTDRVDQELQEVGNFGEEGWQRTVINRFIKEFHDDPNDPFRITREIVWKTEARVSAKADDLVREISIEVQTDRYDFDWRLKIGYEKITQLYTALPGASAMMREVQREINQIIWTSSLSNPSELIKTWELTEISGTVLVENPDDDEPTRISLYEANRTNSIPEDDEGVDVENGRPITTIIERWRETGPDQIEVQYQKIDHLTGRPEQTKTVQHTGTVKARMNQSTTGTVSMMIRNEASEALFGPRVPASLDAGNVPFDQALMLAERLLALGGAEPGRIQIRFTGLDLSLRRGSLRRITDRQGVDYIVFITGYRMRGERLGTPEFEITMEAEGVIIG
jgi:hypothetical protein